MMAVTPFCDDGGMDLVVSIVRPRPFEELTGQARDREVLDAVRQVQRANAYLLSLVDAVDMSMSYRDDEHGSVRAWVQAVSNSSVSDAARLVASTRLLRDLPVLADAYTNGEIGASQLATLTQVRKNPRCRTQLPAFDALVTDLARTLDFNSFQQACARIVALADPDGTHHDHDAAHERRNVSASIVGTDFRLDAHGGSIDGATMIEILDHLTDAEFQADWAELVAEHGDNPPVALIRRTPAQRRFDALRTLFNTAAAASQPATPREPHVDFVIDLATFETTMRRMVGLSVDEPDLSTVISRRCETGTGVSVDPVEIVAAAIMGRVRRVVIDGAGIVIDAGRSRRFFTNTLAEIIRALNQHCTWPGCHIPARRSQLDHAAPWGSATGPTSAANANILCGRHNRSKNHGFHTWRDPTGHWHTTRPDGTEITPRTQPHTGPSP